MIKVFQSEFLKLRKSTIWLLIFISPILSTIAGLAINLGEAAKGYEWVNIISSMAFIHALLFLPLLTGVFSAFVCRYEHIGGGWKQLLSMPVSRSSVYITKLLIVLGLIALSQLLFFIGFIIVIKIKGITGPILMGEVFKSVLGGWIACMPLAALQMFVSVLWSSFAAPLAINVVLTIPNILIANSEKFGPYYPWTQPVLAMVPHSDESFGAFNIPFETLLLVIIGSFILFFLSGLMYFQRKEV